MSMPDDKTIRHPLDGKRIDVNDRNEIRNWCKILDIEEFTLKLAVIRVGTSSEKVREYLKTI